VEPTIDHARALDLLLNRQNPRHEPKRNQAEIIEYLLRDEQVYNLARHMSANGVNPLEITAVYPDEEGNLVVAEGNRRVCALQLLNDPAKVPSDQRDRFKTLLKNAHFPETILVAVFDDYEQARPWLKILHDGEQDGVGRRRWRTEQKARFTQRSNTSTLAVRLLDYAIAAGLISKEEKDSISLTTMTRYLENPKVRAAMGIRTTSTNPEVRIDLPSDRFGPIVSRFIEDARVGILHSRSKSEEWHAYATDIIEEFSTDTGRVQPQPLEVTPGPARPAPPPSGRKAILKRASPDRIQSSDAVVTALNALGSAKLSSIYNSLTTLSLSTHPALMTAGAWVFLESLTAVHGRHPNVSFESYVQGLAGKWGLTRDEKKEIRLSIVWISESGNVEKHSPGFTSLDARNLRNHFDVLDSAIARLIAESVQ
jgi:hypothetical protein